jgi:hypothetical protein
MTHLSSGVLELPVTVYVPPVMTQYRAAGATCLAQQKTIPG